MKYTVKINPEEKIQFEYLHRQLNGLEKLQYSSYSAECLLLKFIKKDKFLTCTLFDSETGKVEKEIKTSVIGSPDLKWLYYLLKEDVKYPYLDTIFPSTVFGVTKF